MWFSSVAVTNFIGISFGVLKDRVNVIATSTGVTITNADGMTTREVLAALVLIRAQEPDNAAVFVVYDAAVDFELAFRDLGKWDKDRLFGVWRMKEERIKDTPLYEANRKAETVEYEGMKALYLCGKILKLNAAGAKRRGLTIYDIASYFDYLDSAAAGEVFLNEPLPKIERHDLDLWKPAMLDKLIERCQNEAALTARLAAKVESVAAPLNLNLRQWYGPSAIAARCLAKWGARRQAKRLNERNSPYELLNAIDRAYFGGRVEAIKVGTVRDVSVLDINSAYAYAATLLSQFAQPLRFTRQFDPSHPFSLWLVDYELPPDTLLGILPNRAPAGSISFRLRGKGYFWGPEVEYLAAKYPGCYEARWGYIARDAKPVEFAKNIEAVYEYRNALKAKGDAGQKILKLALANLYGKFAQNQGGAYYQCRAWAGWITSYVRRMMLDAVDGIEDRVVSFNQDAIHVEGAAPVGVSVGDGLGQWKYKRYASGLYVAPGIYDLTTEDTEKNKEPNKQATRGANLALDFDRIATELSEAGASELQRAFFVGWQLARMAPVKYEQDYLSEVSERLQLIPGKLRARNYPTMFDWKTESRNSTINGAFSGSLSARYQPTEQNLSLRLRLRDRGFV